MDYFGCGNYYSGMFVPAFLAFEMGDTDDASEYLDRLLEGKDEIDKRDVMSKLDQFSCREELERYVESKTLPRLTDNAD